MRLQKNESVYIMKGNSMSRQSQSFERDNLLVEFINQNKGRNNCVSSKSILQFLSDNGYKLSPTSLYPIIHKLMCDRNLPICYVSMRGYYIATSKEDIMPVIDDLQVRMSGFQRHVEHLIAFLGE